MCIQGERLLCELSSDEIIINKGNMRSVIWGVNQHIYLVYIMIPDKGIAMFGLAYTFSVC